LKGKAMSVIAVWGETPEKTQAQVPKGTQPIGTPRLVEGRQSDPFGKGAGAYWIIYYTAGEQNAKATTTQSSNPNTTPDPFTYIDPSYTQWSIKLETESQ
jgi:hypothetical protein